MTTQENEIRQEETFNKIKNSFSEYAKIIAFSFIIPLWVSFVINGGAVLWKMISWLNQNIQFWTINEYLYKSILILIFPIVYLLWFYHLVIKKALLQLHEDFFKEWNNEIGTLVAESIIKLKNEGKDETFQFDVEIIMIYLNRKLAELPNILEWIGRKLIDQIPFLEFINALDIEDLENKDKESLAKKITHKINAFDKRLIDSIVPTWTKFVIPINIILLLLYLKT